MREPSFLSGPSENFDDWAQEFLASPAAGEFRPDLRDEAASALPAFLKAASRRAGGSLEEADSGHFLRALRHDLGVQNSQMPGLVAAFLSYLQDTGRLSDGAALGESLRTGGVGAEDRAPAPSVGRNDPCPCGSGKKYKKCCGG